MMEIIPHRAAHYWNYQFENWNMQN